MYVVYSCIIIILATHLVHSVENISHTNICACTHNVPSHNDNYACMNSNGQAHTGRDTKQHI